MRFRKLRIAWSVVWGLAAVLLIALWVRSYDTDDHAVGCVWDICVEAKSKMNRVLFTMNAREAAQVFQATIIMFTQNTSTVSPRNSRGKLP